MPEFNVWFFSLLLQISLELQVYENNVSNCLFCKVYMSLRLKEYYSLRLSLYFNIRSSTNIIHATEKTHGKNYFMCTTCVPLIKIYWSLGEGFVRLRDDLHLRLHLRLLGHEAALNFIAVWDNQQEIPQRSPVTSSGLPEFIIHL